jgi:hypothetical protein
MKKDEMILYEFKKFNPRTHRTKRYGIGFVEGKKVMFHIGSKEFKLWKKAYKMKLRKVV